MDTKAEYTTDWAESICSLTDILSAGLDGLMWTIGTWGLSIINWRISKLIQPALDTADEKSYNGSDAQAGVRED